MRISMRIAASTAAVLTIISLSVPAGAAPGRDPKPGGTETADSSNAKLGKPTKQAPREVVPTITAGKFDCAKVKADPRKFIPKGKSEIGCISSSTPALAAAATAPAPPVSCSGSSSFLWLISRRSQCLWGWVRSYQTVDTTGKVTGTATLETATDMSVGQALSWNEKWFVTMTAATGRLTTMNVIITRNCGTGCTTLSTPATAQALTVGKTVTGTINSAAVPLGRTEFAQSYTLTATNPSGDTLAPITWGGALPVRCDRILAPAGCILPITGAPILYISRASTPTVEAGIENYQAKYPDAWGKTTLVRQLADTSLQQASSSSICAGFVPDSRVADDTCFLFPFDSNYENGYLLGLQPGNCSETRPVVNADGTITNFLKHSVTYTERCFIGHMAAADVTLFRQQLSDFRVANRILDQDPYAITLTL